jgi:uncharacterized membrane protein (DUF441 family)
MSGVNFKFVTLAILGLGMVLLTLGVASPVAAGDPG